MTSLSDRRTPLVPKVVRMCRGLLVAAGLVLGLGLGGISVEVVWAQPGTPVRPEAETSLPAESAVTTPAETAEQGPGAGAGLIEAERAEAEKSSAPPTAVPPERERVVLNEQKSSLDGWPSGVASDLLTGHQVSTESPEWSRPESGVTESDGVLLVRSRRFSSPKEACQDLTELAVGWLRQKYEPEMGREIQNPVAVLRQNVDKVLVLQSYVQEIPLNGQKVIETPMYIAHLRMLVTPELREAVYSDWRAQLLNLSLVQLVGGAAMLSLAFAGLGRWLRSGKSPFPKQPIVTA